jgi:hypothetical protein
MLIKRMRKISASGYGVISMLLNESAKYKRMSLRCYPICKKEDVKGCPPIYSFVQKK